VKSAVLSAFLLFFSAGALFAGAGSENASANTIDEAVAMQGRYIIERAENDVSIVIVQISSDHEKLSKYIIDELPNYIIGNDKGIVIVERQRLDLIENEVLYQMSGNVSDDEVISIGERIGARLVVTGSVSQIGDMLRLNIKIIDVKTAGLVGSNSCDIKIDQKVESILSNNGQIDITADAENQKKTPLFQNDFSRGVYIGYTFSPTTPIGFSVGMLENERLGFYLDSEFKIPSFDGHDTSSTYNDKGAQGSYEAYADQNRSTNFVWEEIMGISGALYLPHLWWSAGIGFNYNADYKLFKKPHVSAKDDDDDDDDDDDSDDNMKWFAPASPDFDFLIQAGLHFKLKRLLLSLKYKYIFNYGSSFDVGIGFVLNIPSRNTR
jgi:hypothetical protein